MDILKGTYKDLHIIDLTTETDLNSVIDKINSITKPKLVILAKKFYKQVDFNTMIKKIKFQELDIYRNNDLMDYRIFIKN